MAPKRSDEVRRLARNEVITTRRMKAVGWTRYEIHSLERRELLFPAHSGVGRTASELEADFYELAARAGLPKPLLQCHLPGGRADSCSRT